MKTIASLAEKLVRRSPLLREALDEGIANTAEVARRLKPVIEAELLVPVSVASIAIAVQRMKFAPNAQSSGLTFLKQLKNITVRSNLVEYVLPSHTDLVPYYTAATSLLRQHPDAYLNISRGLFESVVIVSGELEAAIAPLIAPKNAQFTMRNLSAITLKLPAETIEAPGVYYPILKALAWDGITIIEVVSVGSELSLILSSGVVDRAFSVIKTLTTV
jgi:hypothetical protein